jgi:hypothetical protein
MVCAYAASVVGLENRAGIKNPQGAGIAAVDGGSLTGFN